MIFQSLDYLVFLVVVLAAYWVLPRRGQNLWLLAASYFFYAYVHLWFLVLIAFCTIVNYACARGITERPEFRTAFLRTSILASLGLLGVFKYFHFFVDNVIQLVQAAGLEAHEPTFRILLPVGISFYTFQAVSYVIDVYRGDFEARKSLLDVALFIAFFPQLVAGPIERARHLLPQFESARRFDGRRALDGLVLIVWGFFKKLVIADNVAVIANKIFLIEAAPFPLLWAGVFAFCIQIYADFSAYTDIARGTAKFFGINLIENFRHPYLSSNPNEFWRRWHISLSTWLRDYVYISLGGNRVSRLREAGNVMVTFLASGLWHGASWNFILWGGYHGALVVLYRVLGFQQEAHDHAPAWKRVAAVVFFFGLTNLGWLFFREGDGVQLLASLTRSPFSATTFEWEAGFFFFALAWLYATPLWMHGWWDTRSLRTTPDHREERTPLWVTVGPKAALSLLLFVGILILRAQTSADFIYFQF